jgi:hypothetical protein
MDLGNIRARMEVVGADGEHLGTVDHVEQNRIKLLRNDPAAEGQHHWLPQDVIAAVEGNTVRLSVPAAAARRAWQGEATVQAPVGEGRPAGILGDAATGAGGQSVAHAPGTLGTTAAGEPGPRPDKPLPDAPSRDKERGPRH